MNPMLLNVLLISLLVHVAALVIFGSWTLVKYVIPDEADFEEPPAIEEVEPPKEVKIEITNDEGEWADYVRKSSKHLIDKCKKQSKIK